MGAPSRVQKPVQLGLGDAIDRRELLRRRLHNGTTQTESEDRRELELLREALNEHKLDLGLDCDGDGVPDTEEAIEALTKSAQTGCCSVLATKVARKSTSRRRNTGLSPRRGR